MSRMERLLGKAFDRFFYTRKTKMDLIGVGASGDDPNVMVGRSGRVTSTVSASTLGEVMIPIRGGSEAFMARVDDPADRLDVGTSVVVTEYHPPRTVIVVRSPR